MGTKLAKSTFPAGHGPADFKCFGPPAMKDGQFDGTLIADMGCFNQAGVDSNKYYHACVCQSTKDGSWYAYFEWGRVGAGRPQFQFVACGSQADAQQEYIGQCREKNDKRGQWVNHPVLGQVLQAKPGKDCYLVRPLATRVTGLPDAKTIKLNEGAKPKAQDAAPDPGEGKKPKPKAKPKVLVDKPTIALLRDLGQATVQYTRTSMADASIPTQAAIDEARQILQAALQRVGQVGDRVEDQVADTQIQQYTTLMYGRIPKRKELRAAADTWILSANNILLWQQDLDAFESALYIQDPDSEETVADPYNGMKIHMEWLDPSSEVGKFVYSWWPAATRNKHGNVGAMKILNAWKVIQHEQTTPFRRCLEAIQATNVKERCLHQPAERIDVDGAGDAFKASNVNLLFHGTRSVNVSGILRERLKLPRQLVGVVINGAMFGPGLYWADDWKKSAQYTSLGASLYARGGGGLGNRGAFMFAADVIIGNPFVAKDAHGYTKAPDGHHTVMGKHGFTASWGAYGGLQNNEWIVYQGAQHQMRYLIEFTEDTAQGRRWR